MTPRFPNATPSLHAALKSRVNEYFDEGKLETKGNSHLYTKAIVILAGLVGLYIHLVFFTPIWYIALPECAILGLFITATGFNVMHDGSHGSFSTRTWMNTLAGATLECLGGSAYIWKVKHCMIHHSFTNVEGVDDDINIGYLMRVNEHQRSFWFHRFQHLYCWFLYSMVYIVWIFQVDYQRYFTGRIGPVPMPKMKPIEHVKFWLGKLVNACLFFAIPIYRLGAGHALLGFAVAAMTAGVTLTVVFQLAHTVEGPEFPVPDDASNMLPDQFAIHQIATTANFATQSKVMTWLVGGLNFQIEHHLFPRIAHVHYPEVSKIVRQVCEERGIAYVEHKTFRKAVLAHIHHLKTMAKVRPEPIIEIAIDPLEYLRIPCATPLQVSPSE
jgi:linoleoyl-CoA desaturase